MEVQPIVSPRSLLLRVLIAALALPGTLAITACGGSSTTTGSSTASSTTSTAQTTTTSGLHRAFDNALRRNLINVHHLSKTQASCVIGKLDRTLSDAEIAKTSQGKSLPSVARASRKAGAACALKHR